ncbi:MAG TPA: hypothetical protein VLG13_00630 [Patescibacteria group bacterium]|nr:hypothetical protein [Patescibacteria group bacterium]
MLTERTINVGARKSNNFHKLSTEELKQEIEASLPDSAPHVLTYPVERVIVVGGFVPYLAWLLRDAQEVANEQSRLHETICRLSGVALPSYRSEPFVSLAKFHGGYISEATVAAAEKNKPDYIDLAPVAIMPTKALTDQ